MEVNKMIAIMRKEIEKCIKEINQKMDIAKVRMFDCHFFNGFVRFQILYQDDKMKHPVFYAKNFYY